jgi:hypothetical protein
MVTDHERKQLLKAPVNCTEINKFIMTMLQTDTHIPTVQYSVSNRKAHVNSTKILKPLLADYAYRSPLTNILYLPPWRHSDRLMHQETKQWQI